MHRDELQIRNLKFQPTFNTMLLQCIHCSCQAHLHAHIGPLGSQGNGPSCPQRLTWELARNNSCLGMNANYNNYISAVLPTWSSYVQ